MTSSPLVSIVIPTYNRPGLLYRSLSSAIGQTYENTEIIVVDDGSQSNIRKVISCFDSGSVKLLEHDENKGGSAARNTGISEAKGEFIAFLDSDDEWLPTKIEKQMKEFEDSSEETGVVYCQFYTMHDDTGYAKSSNTDIKDNEGLPVGYYSGDVLPHLLRGWCPATTSQFIVKRECLSKERFDEKLASFQDYDLWIRLAMEYEFSYVEDELVVKHSHSGDQISSNIESRKAGIEQFFAKWEDEFLRNCSQDELERLIGTHFSEMYWENTINAKDNIRRLQLFKKYLKNTPVGFKRRIILFLCILIFGKKAYSIPKLLYQCLSWEPYSKIDKGF